MERKKKGLYGLVFVVMIGVMALAGIGFAALSQTLTISGTATVPGATWDVRFQNLSAPTFTGGASVDPGPILSETETSISGFNVKLTKPSDKVVYTFDITNNGTLNAKLGTYTGASKTATGSGETAAADVAIIGATGENVTYTIEYVDGAGKKVPAVDDILNVGQTRTVTLTVELNPNLTQVPANAVTVSLGDTIFSYVQV